MRKIFSGSPLSPAIGLTVPVVSALGRSQTKVVIVKKSTTTTAVITTVGTSTAIITAGIIIVPRSSSANSRLTRYP